MKKALAIIGSVVGGVFILGLLFIIPMVTTSNTAIRLENQVETAKANINKEQNRRVTLFNNLVNATESYNKYEADTQKKIVSARTKANKGNVEGAKVELNAVAEKYPELKAQKNYSQTMTEFSKTENRLADYTESYNSDIKSYNNYTETFPRSFFLSLTGHSVQHYTQSSLEVNPSDGNNLFK